MILRRDPVSRVDYVGNHDTLVVAGAGAVEKHVSAEVGVVVVVHEGNRQIRDVADRRGLFVHARLVPEVSEQVRSQPAGNTIRAVRWMPKPLDCDVAHNVESRAADHGDYRERAIEVAALLNAAERRHKLGSGHRDRDRDGRHGQYSDGNSNVVTERSASVMIHTR